MADRSLVGDQPRVDTKDLSPKAPSIQYRTMSSKPTRRTTGRTQTRF